MQRRQFIGSLATATLATAVVDARAQSYPSRLITMVVAYAPGGSTDIVAFWSSAGARQ